MRVEELSNRPAAQLRRTEFAIAEQQRSAIGHERAVWELRIVHDRSRTWWQWVTLLRHRREERAFRKRAPRADRTLPHRLAQQQAGVDAEERVTQDLRVLSDEWTAFRGYANRHGEVDHVLVGPRGVWAIEVKGRGIRVNVTGDDWWFDKFDRYGNLVERGALSDRGGRNWGRQVTEAADDLERFFRSRGAKVTVRTAVVVVHERAELGIQRDLRVDALSIGTDGLLRRIAEEPERLDAPTRSRIIALIRRDHQFHAGRRAQPRFR